MSRNSRAKTKPVPVLQLLARGRQHDGAWAEMVEQGVGDLPIMRLACGQTERDRQALRVDDNVDFGYEPAA